VDEPNNDKLLDEDYVADRLLEVVGLTELAHCEGCSKHFKFRKMSLILFEGSYEFYCDSCRKSELLQPIFDAIRKDPRFPEFIESVESVAAQVTLFAEDAELREEAFDVLRRLKEGRKRDEDESESG
jgi:hypothetical protein